MGRPSVKDLMNGVGSPPQRNNARQPVSSAAPKNEIVAEPEPEAMVPEKRSKEAPVEEPVNSEQQSASGNPSPQPAVVRTSRKRRKEVQTKESIVKLSGISDDFNYRGSMVLPDELRIALKLRSMRERCTINDIVITALERELSSGKYDDIKAARTFMHEWSSE